MRKGIIVLVFSLILILSCQGNKNNSSYIKPQIFTNNTNQIFPIIFEGAFSNDTSVKQDTFDYDFKVIDIGILNVESGKIIASDPIVMHDRIAFTQDFPIGRFPVQVAVAKSKNFEVNCFCRINFSNEEVVKWEFALLPGQKKITLTDSIIYCYSVDASMALFIDETANKIFNKKTTKEWESDWENIFVKKSEECNNKAGFIHTFNNHNFATFFTGNGDGCYATYIGFDKENQVCRLLTDFGIIRWWTLK